jgi:hypothetical protein
MISPDVEAHFLAILSRAVDGYDKVSAPRSGAFGAFSSGGADDTHMAPEAPAAPALRPPPLPSHSSGFSSLQPVWHPASAAAAGAFHVGVGSSAPPRRFAEASRGACPAASTPRKRAERPPVVEFGLASQCDVLAGRGAVEVFRPAKCARVAMSDD